MAFNPLKRLFGVGAKKPQAPVYAPEPEEEYVHRIEKKSPANAKARKAARPARPGKAPRRTYWGESPYTKKPSLARENMALLEKAIRKSPGRFKTDKFTLLEIADRFLQSEIGMPRPPLLRAHHIFNMFVRKSGRTRSGVTGACLEWRGAYRAGAPAITTVNAIHGHRLVVDARKYIVENPVKGKRRNFRSKPYNLCGNESCVNPRHIEMRGLPRELKSGENHARAKYPDKLIRKMAKEYNAGATAKELAKKYGMIFTYVEQIMRKEKRTEATEGMTIRGRFGSR